jgi:hypothetical protein
MGRGSGEVLSLLLLPLGVFSLPEKDEKYTVACFGFI